MTHVSSPSSLSEPRSGRYRRQGHTQPDDVRHPRQGHVAGTQGPPIPSCQRLPIPPAFAKAPGTPRSGTDEARCRDLRSRLLLAPACRVPIRDAAGLECAVLAHQVRAKRCSRPSQGQGTRATGVACLRGLGMQDGRAFACQTCRAARTGGRRSEESHSHISTDSRVA